MARLRVLIVGSGERVRAAALPVFERAKQQFELAGVVSRRPKEIESEGRRIEVSALDALTSEDLKQVDLVYMVVAKPAVPSVVARLRALGVAHVDLLIETPVMLFRHFGHLDALRAFRHVWVSEDTASLPCFGPVRSLARSRELGALKSVQFEESAYAYHGVAMAKAVLGGSRVKSAVQSQRPDGRRDRVFKIELEAGGVGLAHIIDPRDYSKGKLRFEFERGVLVDHEAGGEESCLRLEAVTSGDELTGFRAGDHLRELDDAERSLMGTRKEGAGLTAWMDGMKRVGFLELVRDIAAGGGAYALDQAIEDAVIDYHLEKFKRYLKTPLTDPRKPLARLTYKLLTRLARR